MSFQKGNTYGKKPKYTKKEEIEGLIDKYFEDFLLFPFECYFEDYILVPFYFGVFLLALFH